MHQAATPSSPPLIGLLGVTNGTEAAEQFKQLRGDDTSEPLVHADQLSRVHLTPKTRYIFPVSSVSTFLGGALFMILFRICRDRGGRRLKRKGIHVR